MKIRYRDILLLVSIAFIAWSDLLVLAFRVDFLGVAIDHVARALENRPFIFYVLFFGVPFLGGIFLIIWGYSCPGMKFWVNSIYICQLSFYVLAPFVFPAGLPDFFGGICVFPIIQNLRFLIDL